MECAIAGELTESPLSESVITYTGLTSTALFVTLGAFSDTERKERL
jgi:hypothetical protein